MSTRNQTPRKPPTVRALTSDLFRRHQFQSSRPWPDGTRPTGPDWNPGCTCGTSHYYFEHSVHLAEVTAEHLSLAPLQDLAEAARTIVADWRQELAEAEAAGLESGFNGKAIDLITAVDTYEAATRLYSAIRRDNRLNREEMAVSMAVWEEEGR